MLSLVRLLCQHCELAKAEPSQAILENVRLRTLSENLLKASKPGKAVHLLNPAEHYTQFQHRTSPVLRLAMLICLHRRIISCSNGLLHCMLAKL